MKKIRIAIIGCGIITKKMHLPAIQRLSDDIEVVSVCNRSIGKAQEVANILGLSETAVWTDWEEMISKVDSIDAVLIALPIPMNHPVSKACCEAGLSVLCEKPAGMTIAEAEDTGTFSEVFGVNYMTAENYQYDPKYVKAAQLLQKGLIGELHSITWNLLNFMRVDNEYNKTQWRAHNQYPGGYVMDGGVHFVHTLQMMAGPIESVFAHTSSLEEGLGTMDHAMALLKHRSGVTSSLNMSWRSCGDDTNLKLHGKTGSLIVTDEHIIQRTTEGIEIIHEFEDESSFYLMWKDYLNSLRTGEAPAIQKDSPIHDVKVILAIIESGKTGDVKGVQ